MSRFLFTYGTLMPGHAPACVSDLVARFNAVGRATITGTLYDLRSYPGLLIDGADVVQGHVCELPNDDLWRGLDTYEGFDPAAPNRSLFRREIVVATLADGRRVDCQTYVYNRPVGSAPVVASGDWTRRSGQPARQMPLNERLSDVPSDHRRYNRLPR